MIRLVYRVLLILYVREALCGVYIMHMSVLAMEGIVVHGHRLQKWRVFPRNLS